MGFGGWEPRVWSKKEKVIRFIALFAGIMLMFYSVNGDIIRAICFIVGFIIIFISIGFMEALMR